MNDFLLNGLPTVAGVVLAIAYLPQIVRTYRTKDVTGVSVAFWVVLNVALSMLLLNSIIVFNTTGVWGYMLVEIFNEGLAFVMLCLVLRYKK